MKESLSQNIEAYKRQMKLGTVPKAYKGLMEYLRNLRTYFTNQYSSELIVGNFYQGYMDISYFAITSKSLKSQKLKTALIFNHKKMRFEIWLVGQNKQIQKKYWDLFKANDWNKYAISNTAQHSIIEHLLVENPNFRQLDLLTEKVETETIKFIKDIIDALN